MTKFHVKRERNWSDVSVGNILYIRIYIRMLALEVHRADSPPELLEGTVTVNI